MRKLAAVGILRGGQLGGQRLKRSLGHVAVANFLLKRGGARCNHRSQPLARIVPG